MGLAVVASRALAGIEAPEVRVEVHLGAGLPAFHIVGLPEAAVREARDRVRAALGHARFEFPARRITVNLAPANLPKQSSHFDLPIALGILAASGQLPVRAIAQHEFVGELSLTGALRGVRGAFAMSLAAGRASRALVLPQCDSASAALAADTVVLPAATLLEVCAHLVGESPLERRAPIVCPRDATLPDLCDVKGQAHARRALEVAAAGGHALLMLGPPGTGKSMLAARMPGLLPPLDERQARECATIHSACTSGFDPAGWGHPPYRAPHHTASRAALVGGGNPPRPGEISLAHHGVLFLDEQPEFGRTVLDALREPLETGAIAVSRAAHHALYPARFQLLAAMNPCPCGWLGHAAGRCRCTPEQVARYRARVSGPIADRIDIKIEAPAPTIDELHGGAAAEPSAPVRARVSEARARQALRQQCTNSALQTAQLEVHCQCTRDAGSLLAQAMRQLSLSARAYHRVLRVARTIADLAVASRIDEAHIAEAIQYRRLDAQF